MYMSDPTILPRVQEYLESNLDEVYVDINVLADELQNKYREYSKRKRSAFRASVTKAYSILLQKSGVDSIQKTGSTFHKTPARSVENANTDDKHLDSVLHKELSDLYTTSFLKKSDANELIDISSDEEENVAVSKETPVIKNRTNGRLINGRKVNISGHEQESNRKRKLEKFFETSKRKRTSVGVSEKVTCNFKSVGGMDSTLEEVAKMILHMRHPEVYQTVGIAPPRGLLLHGPPGSGKTLLAKAIAGELNIPLLKVAAPELVAGVSGESEERIRKLFDEASKLAPCVLFIDEIDAITPSRQNAQKEMERRIVAQLISCLDELNENNHNILVVGASNRLDSIDAALRRAGRFDREVSLGIPDAGHRLQILKLMTSNLKLTDDFNFELLASLTPGYVGADLLSLAREAAMVAINRSFKDLEGSNKPDKVNGVPTIEIKDTQVDTETQAGKEEHKTALEEVLSWLHNETGFPESLLRDLRVTMSDFQEALRHIQPSAKREGFATIPDVTWDDVGSLRDIREELQMAIVAPVRHSKQFRELGISVPAGVLLCGPPGCGKTLLAKAIANEAGINFISVKGPELLNMYVGESERAVRVCFERARNSSPCVIFFDELDALCPKRSESGDSSTSRVVNQLLTEMDGVEGRVGVFLLAASNRPDIIDPAVLRPGRLDKVLFVDLPLAADRVDILKAITKNGTVPRMAPDVSLEDIGKSEHCKGFTGADLAALVREASVVALKEFMVSGGDGTQPITVKNEHFYGALSKVRPSVSDKDSKRYERLRQMYSSLMRHSEVEEMEYP